MDNPQPRPQPDGTRRMGGFMIHAAWIAALLLLTLLFNDVLDRQQNPNRDLAAYRAHDSSGGPLEVVLQRDRGGHYVAPGFINGEPVRFLVDTGATELSVPIDVAERLGLRRGRPSWVSTANGTITVFDTTLEEVALGPIVMRNVPGHINPAMPGDTVLLGMSFMRDLELVQKNGTLTLRQ